MRLLCTIACILVLQSYIFALTPANPKLDSLLQALIHAEEDTDKVQLLVSISEIYTNLYPDTGIIYGLQAIDLATTLKWEKEVAQASYYVGFSYYNKSDYPKALEYLFKSLRISETIHYENGIANSLRKIGNVYRDQKNYTKALEHYHKALKIFEKNNDKLGISKCYSNIGEIYSYEYMNAEAMKYHEKALRLQEEVGYYNGMVITYYRMGDVYMNDNNYAAGLKQFEKALNILKMHPGAIAKEQVEETLGGAGAFYLEIAKMDAYQQVSLSKKEVLQRAVNYLTQAIAIATEMGQLTDIATFSDHLSSAYALSNDYVKAYENLRFSSHLVDSLFSARNNRLIVDIETRREKFLKEKIQKISAQKRRNELITVIAAFAVLLWITISSIRSYKSQQHSNAIIVKEKTKSDNLLLNILPGQVAEELKEKGSTTAKHFDEVTVLFTDFVNFTIAGERMGTQKLVDELHNCFKKFDEIMSKYNIEKIKTIGDAYLAVCGLPVPDTKHAENVMNAAMEIRAFMVSRRLELGEDTFEVRIGIHSGPVVAGIVGVKKFAYDIWGDTVNTAARMEQKSEAGKINISQTTYELVKDRFSCIYRGEIEAKNKGMLKMYFAESAIS